MSDSRNRREGLGRNRKIERRKGLSIYHLGIPAMLILSWMVYAYLTVPERRYGWQNFKCSPLEIEWKPYRGSQIEITGCDRVAYVYCSETRCTNANP